MISSLEEHHCVALARELTFKAGFPLRDRYGYAASDETVLFIVNACLDNPAALDAVEAIGIANVLGDIQIADGYDTLTDEEYEMGIVTALSELVDRQRELQAARALRAKT